MAVLSLVKHASKDIVEALESLLELARKGELRGLAIYYRETGGHEDAVFTGIYRTNVAEAVKAAMLMSVYLTRHEERARGKP